MSFTNLRLYLRDELATASFVHENTFSSIYLEDNHELSITMNLSFVRDPEEKPIIARATLTVREATPEEMVDYSELAMQTARYRALMNYVNVMRGIPRVEE